MITMGYINKPTGRNDIEDRFWKGMVWDGYD